MNGGRMQEMDPKIFFFWKINLIIFTLSHHPLTSTWKEMQMTPKRNQRPVSHDNHVHIVKDGSPHPEGGKGEWEADVFFVKT